MEAGTSRVSRGSKDNMMINLRIELASLEKIVSGLLFLYRNMTTRWQYMGVLEKPISRLRNALVHIFE